MKNNRTKTNFRRCRILRAGCCLVILLMTLNILLGCQQKEAEADDTEKIKLSNVFAGEQLTIDAGFSVNDLFMIDGRIFAGCDENAGDQYIRRLAEYADGEWTIVDFPEEVDYQELGIVDGRYVLLINYFDMEKGDSYELCCYEGSDMVWSYDVAELAAYDSSIYIPVSMFCDSGLCWLSVGDLIVVVDADGKVTRQIEVGEDVNRIGALPDGGLYVLTSSGVYTITDGSLSKSSDNDLKPLSRSSYPGIVDGKLWYSNDDGVMIIDADGERMIVDWLASSITPTFINSIVIPSVDEMLFYGSDGLGGAYGLWKYTRVPEDQLPEKTVIDLSYIEDGRGFFKKAAILYNKSQSEYYVRAKDYNSTIGDGTYDDMQQRFMADIVAGNAGDVVCYSDYDWYDTFASKGAVADLSEYLDNPDDIFGCIKRYCSYNDKIYALVPEFSIKTFLSAEDDPIADGGFTMDDIFDFDSSERRLMADMTQASFSRCFLDSVISDCIDYDNASCDFTCDEFVGYLEYYSKLKAEDDYVDIYNENLFASGEVALYNYTISTLSDYLHINYIYAADSRILGYPYKDGANGAKAMISPQNFCSIAYSSKVKAEAADFIEFMISYEVVYDEMRGMRYIPSSRDTLRKICENDAKYIKYLYFYKDTIGSWSGNTQPFDEAQEGPGWNVEVTGESIDALCEFVDSLDIIKPAPNKVKSIVNEELSAYLSGARTAEATADIINSRVGTYLAERQ